MLFDLLKKHWLPSVLLLVFLGGLITFVVASSGEDFSTIENTLIQILIGATGLLGSFIFGRTSARDAATELIKPHARSAFRRVTALYNSLYRLSDRIEEFKAEHPDHRLDMIQFMVNEQIATGQDAMEDWRDIVPEEVEEIEKRNTRR